MERFRLTILVESRIRWKVYVRFGGEYLETYHRNMTRRWVLSLHNQCVKTIHTIYGEKKSLAFLYKLAEETRKLEELCKQIIELTKRYEKEYLTKKE